jgi:hypothetical protein
MAINRYPLDDGRKKRKREKRILKNDSNRRRISTLKPIYTLSEREKRPSIFQYKRPALSLPVYIQQHLSAHFYLGPCWIAYQAAASIWLGNRRPHLAIVILL